MDTGPVSKAMARPNIVSVWEGKPELNRIDPEADEELIPQSRAQYVSEARARRAVIVHFRQRAARCTNFDQVLADALRTIADVLGARFTKYAEYDQSSDVITVRALFGWPSDMVGMRIENASSICQSGYALRSGRTLVVEDLRIVPELMTAPYARGHRLVSGVTVLVPGPEAPYGALTIHWTSRRAVTPDELDFLQGVAGAIAGAAYEFSQRRAPYRPIN